MLPFFMRATSAQTRWSSSQSIFLQRGHILWAWKVTVAAGVEAKLQPTKWVFFKLQARSICAKHVESDQMYPQKEPWCRVGFSVRHGCKISPCKCGGCFDACWAWPRRAFWHRIWGPQYISLQVICCDLRFFLEPSIVSGRSSCKHANLCLIWLLRKSEPACDICQAAQHDHAENVA